MMCYAVTGGSEGWYAHVDLILGDDPDEALPLSPEKFAESLYPRSYFTGNDGADRRYDAARAIEEERRRARKADRGKVRHLAVFTAKTFRSLAHAQAIANEFARLLGV
jgi:hypothetical protein